MSTTPEHHTPAGEPTPEGSAANQPTTPLSSSVPQQGSEWPGVNDGSAPAQAQMPAPGQGVTPAQTGVEPVPAAAQSFGEQRSGGEQSPAAQAHSDGAAQQPGYSAGDAQPTTPLGGVYQQPAGYPAVAGAPATAAPGAAAPGGHAAPSAFGPALDGAPQQEAPKAPKGRASGLLAGLAIGALLGGLVGGGVAAVVSANMAPQASGGGGGAITLNNPDNATAISGVAAVATPSVVTLEVQSANASGSGSGVVYREDGYIITNAHVVTLDGASQEGASIRVKLSDGRILDGDVVGVDPYADLAVVKVDATDLPAIEVADSDKIDVGDLTVAIGAPLNLANTVTSGVVSALNRGISVGSPLIPQDPSGQQPDGEGDGDSGTSPGFPWDFRFGLPDNAPQEQQSTGGGSVTLPVIQTDASINPGNSGGALLNGSGELIGINVAIASASASSGTAGSNGLGFAIPANLATRVADAIIAGEQPSHGLLGASVADSSQDTDDDANHAGGLLVEVVRGGAAAKAGLKAGDVITAVNGVAAVDGTSVSALIRMNEGGSTITIDYTRGGKPGQVEATLGNLEW